MITSPSAGRTDGVLPGPVRAPAPAPSRLLPLPVGWPLTALLVLYPLWWLLGMGTLIFFVLAVPMAVHLWRNRPIALPPGFGIWVFFLLWVVTSALMLGTDPPGVVPDTATGRLIPAAFYFTGYLSATVILLYVGNLTEEQFPRRRLVRQLGGLFVVVVAGGLLGTQVPSFEFTSPVERLLPAGIASNGFVRSLVHPVSAQLHDVLGYEAPRPAAPFGYTNTWGNAFALLLAWFVLSCFLSASPRRRIAGVVVAAAATVPVIHSLNRGLWLGLGLIVVVLAVRLAARGRFAPLAGLGVVLVLVASVVALSPLGGIIQGRLDNPHSNGIREFTTVKTLELIEHSPVLGLGNTRSALGSANSIAVGESPQCPNCGNPVLGSNGQIWLVLVSQGYGGVILYSAFFGYSLWAFRRDRTPIGDAGLIAIVLSLFFMFIYNAVAIPLALSFLCIAVLWRNQRDGAADPLPSSSRGARPALEAPA